jgi:hypothetical protein
VTEALLLVGVAALVWLWWDGAACKEQARHYGKRRSKELDVQFLDDTVALGRLTLCRDRSGHAQFARRYDFEFSSDGSHRYQGRITLCGHGVRDFYMEPYRYDVAPTPVTHIVFGPDDPDHKQ